jgi:hypothetical protein
MGTSPLNDVSDAITQLYTSLGHLNFAEIEVALKTLQSAIIALGEQIAARVGGVIGLMFVLLFIYLLDRFFLGLGNYTVGAMVNDKMALHANSPFIGTFIKNLGKSCLYNLIYVPISVLYDLICIIAFYCLYFTAFALLPLLIKIFLFATTIVVLTTIKMVFTTDWLPSLICGKRNNRQAMSYTFGRKGKSTASIFSNYLIIILIIMAINVAAVIFTLGAGFLITLPASYMIIISFEFINYYDTNNIKYFTDRSTIIKPEKEHTPTKEEFFKGEN